jgi:hypothetical protein
VCVCCRYPLLYVPAPVTCLRTPSSYACLCAQAPAPRCYAMRLTTQPHLSALSFSAVPCERDYSEPYSTPWAISPESVLPVGPSVVFSLMQYASVKQGGKGRRTAQHMGNWGPNETRGAHTRRKRRRSTQTDAPGPAAATPTWNNTEARWTGGGHLVGDWENLKSFQSSFVRDFSPRWTRMRKIMMTKSGFQQGDPRPSALSVPGRS